LATGKEALNTDTKEPFDVIHMAQAIGLDKLLFKLLKIFLAIRMVEDDHIIHIEEEDNPVVDPKAWETLNRV
jgi:hypothetical protein